MSPNTSTSDKRLTMPTKKSREWEAKHESLCAQMRAGLKAAGITTAKRKREAIAKACVRPVYEIERRVHQ